MALLDVFITLTHDSVPKLILHVEEVSSPDQLQGFAFVPTNFTVARDTHTSSDLVVSKVTLPGHLLVRPIEAAGTIDRRYLTEVVKSKLQRHGNTAMLSLSASGSPLERA
jgi:hypothetical protein